MITMALASRKTLHLLIVLVGILSLAASSAIAAKRIALVIGNSDYKNAPRLFNPRNDANAIAAALTKLDFEVIKGLDLNKRQTLQTFNEFRKKVQATDVALLFYAGHGLQVSGENYLIPTDASPGSELELKAQAMRLATILKMMENPNRISIVLLDACRDNPLAKRLSRPIGTRSNSIGRGLAHIKTGLGTYIGFSAQPDNVALDGDGKHSPFARALLNNIHRENQDIESVMRLVRAEVYKKTNGNQIPWGYSSSIGTGFVFNNSVSKQAVKPVTAKRRVIIRKRTPHAVKIRKRNNNAAEITFWNSIKNSNKKAVFQSYINKFPKGIFVPIAIRRIRILEERELDVIAPQKRRRYMIIAGVDID